MTSQRHRPERPSGCFCVGVECALNKLARVAWRMFVLFLYSEPSYIQRRQEQELSTVPTMMPPIIAYAMGPQKISLAIGRSPRLAAAAVARSAVPIVSPCRVPSNAIEEGRRHPSNPRFMSIGSCVDRLAEQTRILRIRQCHFRTWPAIAAASLRRLRRLRIPRSRWQARHNGPRIAMTLPAARNMARARRALN